MTTWCSNCQLEQARRDDECWACAKYRQRHGVARPQELIQRQIDRYHHNLTPWRPQRVMEG